MDVGLPRTASALEKYLLKLVRMYCLDTFTWPLRDKVFMSRQYRNLMVRLRKAS